jgi:hypothetical protein
VNGLPQAVHAGRKRRLLYFVRKADVRVYPVLGPFKTFRLCVVGPFILCIAVLVKNGNVLLVVDKLVLIVESQGQLFRERFAEV